MANTILTPTAVTRKALLILHQKLNFIRNINRQYDDRFANAGAKIGDTLQIRLPNQYTVRTGAALSVQDTQESSISLTMATQKGVDIEFSSVELTLSLDDFASRVLEPAMAVLAANIEADALSMYKDVYNLIDNDGSAISFLNVLNAKRKIDENLAPPDENARCLLLSPAHNVTFVNANIALFNPNKELSEQWRTGNTRAVGGVGWVGVNTHVTDHTTGTAVKGDTLYDINGANQSGASLTVNTGTTTFLKGDVITLAGSNAVHPETKTSYGYAQQFVITSNSGSSATSLAISPSIVLSGAKQNVSAAPTNTGAVTKVGAGNVELLNSSMYFHKDAFSFVSADLVMPKGVDFAARDQYDGISMRIVRQYDINTDKFPCRLDVLYGYKAIRPQMACRIHADG